MYINVEVAELSLTYQRNNLWQTRLLETSIKNNIALLFNSYQLCSEFQERACNANRLTL
jgi:hypothetical protein